MLKKITIISFIKIFSLNIFYNILNKSFLAHYCIKKCVADTQEFKNLFFFFGSCLQSGPNSGLRATFGSQRYYLWPTKNNNYYTLSESEGRSAFKIVRTIKKQSKTKQRS